MSDHDTLPDYPQLIRAGAAVEKRYPHIAQPEKLCQRAILKTVLQAIDKGFLFDSLAYIQEEFLSNANKANVKRVYFESLNLDIKDPQSYAKGMADFAEKTAEKVDEFSRLLAEKQYYTRVVYEVRDNAFALMVCNNSYPTVEELLRIRNRIDKSKRIRDAAEAFTAAADASESAGLGTITSILMLRGIGAGEDAYHFSIDRERGETVAKVTIPLDTVTQEQAEEISQALAKEVVSIPDYPENIAQLERMLTDGNVPFAKVAGVIQRDPALTAEILKIVNSAQYVLPHKVNNIQNAVSLIGIRGLKNILLFYGTQSVIDEKYGSMEGIWKHAYRCAFYAHAIAREFTFTSLADDAYIAGILHDIGKIVVMSVHPGILENVSALCAAKGIDTKLFEKLTVGISHAAVGGHVAQKWNFPDSIVIPVTFHHRPFLAPDEWIDLTAIVCFADTLCQVNEGRFTFTAIDPDLLRKFAVASEEGVRELAAHLDALYQKQDQK
jgi:HD-like signal output (HDOD) protein